jgi:hypothetical protein
LVTPHWQTAGLGEKMQHDATPATPFQTVSPVAATRSPPAAPLSMKLSFIRNDNEAFVVYE